MGANITPMAKKMGRTVFGVRIGLSRKAISKRIHPAEVLYTYCHAFKRCCRNAVSMMKRYVSPHSQRSLTVNILGGLRLFCFFWTSLCESTSSVKPVWVICCVCDMFAAVLLIDVEEGSGCSRSGWLRRRHSPLTSTARGVAANLYLWCLTRARVSDDDHVMIRGCPCLAILRI